MSRDRRQALVASSTLGAFLFALALAWAPLLHSNAHADADAGDHSCVVTLLTHGSIQQSDAAPPLTPPQPAVEVSNISTLHPAWVPSLFLRSAIFEHAPPAPA